MLKGKNNMKMLVTGVNGQLGYDVVNELKKRGVDCISASRNDFNITDFKSTEKFIEYTKPDIIIQQKI